MKKYALIETGGRVLAASLPVRELRKIQAAQADPGQTEIVKLENPSDMTDVKKALALAATALNACPRKSFYHRGEKTDSYAAAAAITDASHRLIDYNEVFAYAGMMVQPGFWAGAVPDALEQIQQATGTAGRILLATEIGEEFLLQYPIGTDFEELDTDWYEAMEETAFKTIFQKLDEIGGTRL